jgi:N,N'-diacetyllegionaminate synthase
LATLVIAEMGSSHDNDLSKAKRLIDAAKECGANVIKGQWTSNAEKMAARRGLGADAAKMYKHYLEKPVSWLETLKAHSDATGIEWACTSYLIEDIATIAPLVKRFKVSAFESKWEEFVEGHMNAQRKDTIISSNDALNYNLPPMKLYGGAGEFKVLHCVSKYPTPIDDLNLDVCSYDGVDGLSDHTTSTLTGALAVAAGATIVEKHIRLDTTPESNPDYLHSLEAANTRRDGWTAFGEYVRNIREAERAL